MELWIRSQDKDILLKVDSLLIDDNNNDIYTQCWVGVNLETYTLGKYKTKERALEVLDEIQKLLKPQIILRKGKITGCVDDTIIREPDGYDIKELSTYVYEMPEE